MDLFNPSALPHGIVRKGITGIGATTMELFESPRNVILVSPLLSILASKKHPRILTFSGQLENKEQALIDYIGLCQTNNWCFKIHTTAESLLQLETLLVQMGLKTTSSWSDWHLVLDEQDLMQLQAEFRDKLAIAFDIYKEFPPNKRTCVSATYHAFSDPELAKEPECIIKSEESNPRNIHLIITTDTIKVTLDEIAQSTGQVFIFIDSLNWINTLITHLLSKTEPADFAIYCGANSKSKAGVYYQEYTETPSARICFFTSAYFVGCDLKPSGKVTLITVSDPSVFNDKHGLTKAQFVQIHGRIRDYDFNEKKKIDIIQKDVVISSLLARPFTPTSLTPNSLIDEANNNLKWFIATYESGSANAKKRVLKMIDDTDDPPLYIRIDSNQLPTIDYLLIDSTLINHEANSFLYCEEYGLRDYFQKLGHNVIYSQSYYASSTKLIKTKTQRKEEDFRRACKIIRDDQFNGFNSFDTGLFDLNRYNKIIQKESGDTRKYLELYKYIQNPDAFESSAGDMDVLETLRDRKAILRLPNCEKIIKAQLPLNTIMTIENVFAALSVINIETGIPVGRTKKTARKFLSRFCQWEEADTKDKRAVKIVGY